MLPGDRGFDETLTFTSPPGPAKQFIARSPWSGVLVYLEDADAALDHLWSDEYQEWQSEQVEEEPSFLDQLVIPEAVPSE